MSGLSARDHLRRARLKVATYRHLISSPLKLRSRHLRQHSYSHAYTSTPSYSLGEGELDAETYRHIMYFVDTLESDSLFWRIISFAPEAFCRGSARALEAWRNKRAFARPLKPYQITDSLKRSPNLVGLMLGPHLATDRALKAVCSHRNLQSFPITTFLIHLSEQPQDGGHVIKILNSLPHLRNLSLVGGQLDKCPIILQHVWTLIANGTLEQLRFGNRTPRGVTSEPSTPMARNFEKSKLLDPAGLIPGNSCDESSHGSARSTKAITHRQPQSTASSQPVSTETVAARRVLPGEVEVTTSAATRNPAFVKAPAIKRSVGRGYHGKWNLNLMHYNLPIGISPQTNRLRELYLQGVRIDLRRTALPIISPTLRRMRFQKCNLEFDDDFMSTALNLPSSLRSFELDGCWTNDYGYFVNGVLRQTRLEALLISYPKVVEGTEVKVSNICGRASPSLNRFPTAESYLFNGEDLSLPFPSFATMKAALLGHGISITDHTIATILRDFPNIQCIVAANHCITEATLDIFRNLCKDLDGTTRPPCVILCMGSREAARRTQTYLRVQCRWKELYIRTPPSPSRVSSSKSMSTILGDRDSTPDMIRRKLAVQLTENENKHRMHKVCVRVAQNLRNPYPTLRHPILAWRRPQASGVGYQRLFETPLPGQSGPLRLLPDIEAILDHRLWFDPAKDLPSTFMDSAGTPFSSVRRNGTFLE